jgi:hypothetical protein
LSHDYQTTTPTTATIDDCRVTPDGPLSCKGGWNLGGRRFHGDIVGVENLLERGSPVDVRANSERAFTMTYTPSYWVWAYVLGGLLAVAAVALVIEILVRMRPQRGQ